MEKKIVFSKNYTIKNFINDEIENIRKTVGKDGVILALSGGVDSSVAAALLQKAIGSQLKCIFVNTGLMRKNEPEKVKKLFADQIGINLIMVDAAERFLTKLKGITDPEQKRKIIGEEFIRVFEEEKKKLSGVKFLAQGTIFSDVVESNKKNVIKSHHNVGGLPSNIDFKLLEPLKWLFKDEVRQVGLELGLPAKQVYRQPFPGPGLGVRVVGEVTKEKLAILREADDIFCNEIETAGIHVWQYFALCPGVKSVGVKNGKRLFGEIIALRAVLSSDAMHADIVQIPYALLDKISRRICNEVEGVSRVVYDITAKPPGTIEWE